MEPDYNSFYYLYEEEPSRVKIHIKNRDPAEVIQGILDAAHINGMDLFDIIRYSFEVHADLEIMELLIRHDCSTRTRIVHMKDCNEYYLLHHACSYDKIPIKILDLLLKLNPSAASKKDNCGRLPLHRYIACESAHASIDNIKLLLSHYPDSARETIEGGEFPLHVAMRAGASDDVTLALLEQCPEAARTKDSHRWSGNLPLHCSTNQLKTVKELIKIYPEGITALNDMGNSPLHEIVNSVRCSFEVVKWLIEQMPALASTRGNSKRLPLHFVAMRAHVHGEIISFLIDTYPDAVSLVDSNGRLPIHYACMDGPPRDVVQTLCDHHQDKHHGLYAVDKRGNTPLHHLIASKGTADETLRFVFEMYPESARIPSSEGRLPLHVACSSLIPYPTDFIRRIDFIRFLVDADVLTVLKKDPNGRTPFELVASFGQLSVETEEFLAEKQDEIVRLIRDTVHNCGFPDLVVSTVCSFMGLPRILSPVEGEMVL